MSGTAVTVSHPAGLPSTWRKPVAEERFEASKAQLKKSLRGPVRTGYAIVILFVAGLTSWAALAPLAGGASAPGIVSPAGSRRAIQHLEGGIVRELRVRDGDAVSAGDVLVVLESTQSNASFEVLAGKKAVLAAKLARLQAERADAETIAFPSELTVNGTLLSAAQSQIQVFKARKAAHATRKDLLAQRIEQLQIRIKGLEAQKDNVRSQVAFIKEEVEGKETLLQKGLLPKPEALKLRRAETELLGRLSEIENEASKALQEIEESRLQIVSADGARVEEIANDSDKTQSEIAEINERLRSSKDVLNRTTITAPVDGTVINMRSKTIGGVAQGGETLMEIVPRDDDLMIEAHVSPNDIHRVHMGQEAQIHFSAYSTRVMPRIEGIVRSTSADRVREADGQQSYFLARVEIDRQKLKERAGDVVLLPGMSAEVIFVAEKRTALEYLLKPLHDALRRGMLER